MFGRVILKPEIGREPTYDSVYNREERSQRFSCIHCLTEISVDIVRCIGAEACDPESVLGAENGAKVREHFGILNKSLANGWPFLSIHSCSRCGCQYLVYVAVFEPRNGWEQAVFQGITELVPSNQSFNRTV